MVSSALFQQDKLDSKHIESGNSRDDLSSQHNFFLNFFISKFHLLEVKVTWNAMHENTGSRKRPIFTQ